MTPITLNYNGHGWKEPEGMDRPNPEAIPTEQEIVEVLQDMKDNYPNLFLIFCADIFPLDWHTYGRPNVENL